MDFNFVRRSTTRPSHWECASKHAYVRNGRTHNGRQLLVSRDPNMQLGGLSEHEEAIAHATLKIEAIANDFDALVAEVVVSVPSETPLEIIQQVVGVLERIEVEPVEA
jgi:hypothetical protein